MSGNASAAAREPHRDEQAQGAATTSSTGSQGADPGNDGPGSAGRTAAADTHAEFLITSAERDAAEARLREAVADEVLSLEEFGDRIRRLLAARTRGDLHAAVAGLPPVDASASAQRPPAQTEPQRVSRPTGRVREGGSAIAILGSSELKGRWRPGSSTTAVAVLGEATVDLQGVEFEGDELVISAVSALGTVEIVVPEGVEVDLRGIAVLGERRDRTGDTVLPDAPVVRIDGLALLGEIIVRHPKPKERLRLPDGRGAFADRVPLRPPGAAAADRRGARLAARSSTVRQWVAGVLAAIAVAVPLGWALSADTTVPALFGSNEQTISTAELAPGDEMSVGAPLAFGSIAIQVPEGVNVERNGVVVFGSTSCEPCGAQAAPDAPTVSVRTVGAFGSVEVTRLPDTGTQ